jgi:hypothetical protein
MVPHPAPLLKTPVSILILPSDASKKQQKKHKTTNFTATA